MGKKDRERDAESRDYKKADRATKMEMRKKRARDAAAEQNPDDYRAFERQVESLMLRIKDMRGDGNCLFRSLCDQIYGDDGRHLELRQEVCQFMIDHEADFAPFIDEEDGTFAQYSLSMIRV